MKTKCSAIAVLSALLVAGFNASVASASFMTLHGMGLKQTVKIHADGLLADELTVYAGQTRITYEGIDYDGYCVDLDNYAGSSEVTEVGIDQFSNGDMVAYLLETYAEKVSTNLEAAALQVAIWELLFENTGTLDVTAGYFSITRNAAAASEAPNLLGTLPDSHTAAAGVVVLQSDAKQDFVIIPEPGSLILIAASLSVVLMRSRRV